MYRSAALAAVALLGLLAALTGGAPRPVAAAIQTGNCTPDSSWPADNTSLANQVIALVNQHRQSIGDGQLTVSPTLTASAIWKAEQMAAYAPGNPAVFSHDDVAPPVSRTAADRIQTCGYPYSWGENIAYGFPDAQSVVNAWLGSEGHKQNIEDPAFVVTGVGAAEGSDGNIYWVQDFGETADSGSPPPTTTSGPPPTTTSSPPPATTTTATTTTASTTTAAGTTTTTASSPAPPTTTSGGTIRALDVHSFKISSAGKGRLVLTTRVTSDGKALQAASVKCAAAVGKRQLRVIRNVYRSGQARCTWRVPARVHSGTFASGWVRVSHDGLRVVQAFAFRLT